MKEKKTIYKRKKEKRTVMSIKSPWYGRVHKENEKLGKSKYKNMKHRDIEWPALSKEVKKRDGKCVKCGRTSHLEADHFHPLCYVYRSRFFRLSNIQTLCKLCHTALPSMKKRKEQGWKNFVWLAK